MIENKYQAVIGLEVHAQLLTKSKAYSSDTTKFGEYPNTNVSVISLGHPGTLPKANKKVIDYAIMLGIACNCEINKFNTYARKNYFYADLPKGYQITQDKNQICKGGFIKIKNEDGVYKKINLERIHMEEDSGKSIHDRDPFNSLIDLNRAGVPLLEIVTKPDIRSSQEAYLYLTEVRKILRYLEICDGNMEEGSLRCDANISVMLKDAKIFGTRTEVKNMNSISNVKRAIEYEIKRQIKILEEGGKIKQETLNFNAVTGETKFMRSKEEANDYRYFPEPDLPPVILSEDYIEKIKKKIPMLPEELYEKYTKKLKLSDYDASIITENKEIAIFFGKIISHTDNYKRAANYLMGEIKSFLNEKAINISEFPIPPEKIANLVDLVESNKVSNSVASRKIFPELIKYPNKNPIEIANEKNLIQMDDESEILKFAKQSIEKYPQKVKIYQNGKKGLIGLFMGEVMKMSKGKANPKMANKILKKLLNN